MKNMSTINVTKCKLIFSQFTLITIVVSLLTCERMCYNIELCWRGTDDLYNWRYS